MLKKSMLAMSVAAIFATGAGIAQAQSGNSMTPSQSQTPNAMTPSQGKAPSREDRQFVTEAIQGDMAEVKMGQLAQEKGQSQAVKQFGQTLQNDHSANLQKAQQLAQSMGVTPPSQTLSKDQAVYDRLNKLSGAQFDRQFAQAMVRDHREDIVAFLKEAKKSGATANFAKETLPTLRKHLQIARQLTQETATTGSGR